MNFKSKFNVGDQVYLSNHRDISKVQIRKIEVSTDNKIEYITDRFSHSISEDKLFSNVQDAKQYAIKELQKEHEEQIQEIHNIEL